MRVLPSSDAAQAPARRRRERRGRLSPGAAQAGGQRLVRVDRVERQRLKRAARLSRIERLRAETELMARRGPGRCRSCGAEPCGGGWTEDGESSVYCCDRCTHVSPPGWQASHEVWVDGHRQPVMALEMRGGDRVLMRADGVVHWLVLKGAVLRDGAEDGAREPGAVAPLALGRAEPLAVLLPLGYPSEADPSEGDSWGGRRRVGSIAERSRPCGGEDGLSR